MSKESDDRCIFIWRGKSGLHGKTTLNNVQGGLLPLRLVLQKIKLPLFIGEKVRRCGKSAPRIWQQIWHGKPRRKQDQIGVAFIYACFACCI